MAENVLTVWDDEVTCKYCDRLIKNCSLVGHETSPCITGTMYQGNSAGTLIRRAVTPETTLKLGTIEF